MSKIVPVSVGILFNSNNQILIAKRPMHKSYGGLWEFPGGKIEALESPLEALKREFLEELNIHLIDNKESIQVLKKIIYQYTNDCAVHLNIFKITRFIGEPIGAEGQEIKWVEKQQLINYNFPVANHEIIQLLV